MDCRTCTQRSEEEGNGGSPLPLCIPNQYKTIPDNMIPIRKQRLKLQEFQVSRDNAVLLSHVSHVLESQDDGPWQRPFVHQELRRVTAVSPSAGRMVQSIGTTHANTCTETCVRAVVSTPSSLLFLRLTIRSMSSVPLHAGDHHVHHLQLLLVPYSVFSHCRNGCSHLSVLRPHEPGQRYAGSALVPDAPASHVTAGASGVPIRKDTHLKFTGARKRGKSCFRYQEFTDNDCSKVQLSFLLHRRPHL